MKFKLTPYGVCFNDECRAPLFVEMARFPHDALCPDCSTFEFLGFDANGDRAFHSDFGGVVVLAAVVEVPERRRGVCSEACCAGSEV
jgi:hypothetical protein